MNKPSIIKIRSGLTRWSIVGILFACAAVLTVAAASWPPDEPTRKKYIAAFDAVLTHAAMQPEDTAFRTQISGVTAVDAAKAAVQKELDRLYPPPGNVVIPTDIVIMFFKPDDQEGSASKESKSAMSVRKMKAGAFKLTWEAAPDPSHKYHVFSLPPVDGQKHYYKDHLRCCYPEWSGG